MNTEQLLAAEQRINIRDYLLPFGIFIIGVALSVALGRLDGERKAAEARSWVTTELSRLATQLEGQIRANLSVTEGIAQLVSLEGTISAERFAGMARQAIASAPTIRNIVVAPDDVIGDIYPRPGNEKLIGVAYRDLPAQYPALLRARELRRSILAGPVTLIQGGQGLINRRPVFIKEADGAERYWGAVSIVVNVDSILKAGGLIQQDRLQLGLRGQDGTGADGAIFWGVPAAFEQQPVTLLMDVPGGQWQLAALPIGGWPQLSPFVSPLFLFSIAMTALFTFLVARLQRSHRLIGERNAVLFREIEERQQLELSLLQSESRFRTLFEGSPDPCWIIRLNGECTEANNAALAAFGFKNLEAFKRIVPADISPARQPDGRDSAEKAQAMLEAVQEKGLHRFEWVHQRTDGTVFPAEVTLSLITVGGERLIYAAVCDITESKRAQEELAHQQTLTQAILNNAPSLIYMFDPEERLAFCNRYFEQTLGLERDTIVGQRREHFMQAEEAGEHAAHDRQVIADGGAKQFEEHLGVSGRRRTYLSTKCPLLGAAGELIGVLGISTEITELKQYSEQLRLAGVVMENTAEGVLITDADGAIISVNKAFTEITEYSAEEVVGRRPGILRSQRHGPDFYRAMQAELKEKGIWRGEIWNRRKSGALYPEWLTINAVRNPAGEYVNYVAVFSDISAIKRSQADLEQLAHFDALTGLPNRVLFLDRLQQALDGSHRSGRSVAVLLLDLDGFKTVNDSLGHSVGDQLLVQAAERFRKCVRMEDTVSRLGGDEYAVILNNLEQDTDPLTVVKKLLQSLREPFELQGTAALVTGSIGVAVAPQDGDTPEQLLRHADTAMYGAKEEGRNDYRFYQVEMTLRSQERLALERALRRAVEEREFEVWYQPKLDLASGQVDGAEALVRWRDPIRGLVSPADFIPVAERTGLIIQIGEQVLDMVCSRQRGWRDSGLLHGRIAVNVAASQIERSDYVDTLRQALARHQLAAEAIEIEVTESLLMENPERARDVLCAIQALGVTTAVDDFGTGYSSLAYLKVLPINNLKIDRAFVSDLPHDSNDVAITQAIIALGHSLGFKITAEGIESAEQLDFLRQAGCDQAQGYLFGRPMPVTEFEAWLLKQPVIAA